MLIADVKKINLAHISLTLVGLMWVLPFLNYKHQYPLTTFDQEWWSAVIGVTSLVLLTAASYWNEPRIPRIVVLPAGLIGIVLLQSALGMVAYFEQGLLYLMYLLFALLMMMLGARLRECFGLERLALSLAFVLLAGSIIGALIGVLQHFHWHTVFDTVIVVKVSSSVYGNLAQPNHYADYIALGLASLGLLFYKRRLSLAAVVLLAILLLFVMTLSGSRSSWFYLLAMSALAWWGGPRLRPLLYFCLALLAGFVLMHELVQLPFLAGQNSVNTWQRMTGADASGGIRLYLWHEAWSMFVKSPWLGWGYGQFAWQHFLLGAELHRSNISGLFNNAHDLIFQTAVEAGVLGLVVLCVTLGTWLYGQRRIQMSDERWWGYAALSVLCIHSLLEYPLWYAYFLAIAAVLLGALDERHYQLKMGNIGRMSMLAIVLLGLLSLLQLKMDYQLLKQTLAIRPVAGKTEEAFVSTREGLVKVRESVWLMPYAEFFMSSYSEVSAEKLAAKLVLNTRVVHFLPVAQVVYRQAFLLAQDGQFDAAKHMMAEAIWSYPENADAMQQLRTLAQKDPEHFSALLEFASQTEQEYMRAIHNK